jgi:hypothetical protein
MKAGNFVCAALPAVHTHIVNAIKDNPNDIDEKKVNKFFIANTDKFLSSAGVVMTKNCKINNKMLDKYEKILKKFRNTKFLENCELIIDSAGFQIQQGYLDRKEIPKWIDLYHDKFIPRNYKLFDKAFSLDIAPGAHTCPFKSFDEVRDLNKYSYEKVKKYPQEIKNKMIYIHHFRTPNLHEIYHDMLFKDDYADGIKNFSTGGLVSFSRVGKDIPPYIMYVIPMLEILHYAIEKGIKKFRFHVLGGSEWKEILGHKFFERHIKELFDIDVQITFDSSTFFKTLCLGRYTFNPTNDYEIKKMSIRPEELNFKAVHSNMMTKKERFCHLVNEAIEPFGMTNLDSTKPLYECSKCKIPFDSGFSKIERTCPNCNTLDKETLPRLTYTYGLFQLLHLFKKCEIWHKDFVDKNYSFYKEPEKFNQKVEKYLTTLHGEDRLNIKNIRIKAISVYNSLELIEQYKKNPKKALDKCKMIIQNYMVGDECHELKKEAQISTFDNFDNFENITDKSLNKNREKPLKNKRVKKEKPMITTIS